MKSLKKQQFAWAFYDWANSVYSLVITTAIFPVYFGSVLRDVQKVNLFGIQFSDKDILYSYSITTSFIIVVFLSPILSSISDRIGNKKKFLKIFASMGALGSASLFFFTGESTLWVAILGSVTASVGYWGSLVFYNAYLPEIADEEQQDKLSAQGFVYGYIGSSILLITCLLVIVFVNEAFTRYSFILVALWWIGFAQYTFKNLPNSFTKPSSDGEVRGIWKEAHRELFKVGRQLFQYHRIKYFLLSFFFLSVGIQTINYMATRFGDKELRLDSTKLIITILLIQFVAIGGSYLFAWLSQKWGNIKALSAALCIWAGICVSAFLMDKQDTYIEYEFYALGGFVGLVLGGAQSLSRSSYAKLLPKTGDNTIYFSFYDIIEKIALILGSFVFAQVLYLTKSMQYSALCLGLFFIVAILLLRFVRVK